MAIDSRNKRASCLSIGLAIARVLSDPDGSLANVNDRMQSAYLYSGIDAGEATTAELMCVSVSALPVREVSISPAAVRAAALTVAKVRSVSISIEVCDE